MERYYDEGIHEPKGLDVSIISSIGTPIRVFFTCVLNLDKRLPYKEKARESVQYTF